ncbi:MAG TPA: AfsR/SARP family transcriptional regulator [Actinocrinis sp.]|nr:AfsR/SARP family transcriptional regulator [Actinocrinis sp.]
MEFGLLGSLLVRDETGTHVVGAAKQRILLATLLLRPGQVVPVDSLALALWDGRPPRSAATSVRNYVMRLRHALGPAGARISSRPGGYLAEIRDGELDLLRFERLRDQGAQALHDGLPDRAATLLGAAEGLWRGQALADVPSDTLHRDEGPRLAESRLNALELKLEAEGRLGRNGLVIAQLRGLTAAHPERERLWAQLMAALYRDGRQSEALAAYQQVHRMLATEIGVEPGPELRELHRMILSAQPLPGPVPEPVSGSGSGSGSAGSAVPHTATGTAPAPNPSLHPAPLTHLAPSTGPAAPLSTVTPFQIPADLPDFTGRDDEADDLTARLTAPVPTILVTGPPGIGKSALAVHVAHGARASFPDGALYVDLYGTSQTPVAPLAVLASFLRALGLPAGSVPSGLDDRAALFRSALADRRVLILLDDAADSAQVAPLLPGTAASAALVTSRHRLTDLAVGHRRDLDVLTSRTAAQLLGRIIGRARTHGEPLAVADVAAACGGLPLALRIAGARLAARPHWQVGDLAARLADDRRRLDELSTGGLDLRDRLDLAYESLDPATARAFRLVALLDMPTVDTHVAASALGTPEDQAEALLEDLVDAHLLSSDEPGCYAYLSLLRIYAREQSHATDSALERARALVRAAAALLGHSTDATRESPIRMTPPAAGNVLRLAFSRVGGTVAVPAPRTRLVGADLSCLLP